MLHTHLPLRSSALLLGAALAALASFSACKSPTEDCDRNPNLPCFAEGGGGEGTGGAGGATD